MPPAPSVPPSLRRTVFRGSAAVRVGLLTPRQLRSSPWRRVLPDLYAGPDVALDHRVRVRALTRLLLPDAVVSGRSAATLWGEPLADTWEDVEVTVPPGHRDVQASGVRVRRRQLDPRETTVLDGDPLTTVVATAVDLAARRPLVDAVVDVDRLLASESVPRSCRVAVDVVRAAAADLRGRDCRHVRAVLAHADGLAGSPQETRLRLVLVASPLPDPVAQFRVLHNGKETARVDFAWPEQRVAVEYDGLWHRDPAQFRADRARLNRLTAAGWRVVFVTAADLRNPAAVIARIAAELAR